MARVFVRLKLALLANGLRRGWQSALGMVVGAAFAVPISLAASSGIARLGRNDPADVAGPILVLGFVIAWLAWLIGPLFAFGMDETLDPGRLRLLPLERRQLMRGLLAASSIGMGPLATAIVLYGVLLGFAPAGPGALIVVAGVVVQFLFFVTSARALITALSRRLASRRGRDVLTIAAALFGLVIAGLAQLPGLVLGDGPGSVEQVYELLTAAAATLSWLPPAWGARAIAAGAQGDIVQGLAWLAAAIAAVALLLWSWSRSLAGMLEAGAVAKTQGRDADLYPPLLAWAPRTRMWANVAKDFRYAWRVPQLRVQYLIVGLLLVPFAVATLGSTPSAVAVFLAPFGLLLLGTTGFNLFGADRGAVWLLDATGPSPRSDLSAKCIVTSGLAIPIVVVLATGLAASTGGWSSLPAAVLLIVGVQGIVAATGLVVSTLAPFPLPESPTNVFAANAGAGCATMLLQSLGLLVELILIAPLVILLLMGVAAGGNGPLIASCIAVAWGALLLRIALGIASRRLANRGPEFIAALQPRAG